MADPSPIMLEDKSAVANRTYSFDWKLWDEFRLNNETITAVSATASPGDLPLSAASYSGTVLQVTISAGGTAGQLYLITLTVTTNLGHVLERQYQLTLY